MTELLFRNNSVSVLDSGIGSGDTAFPVSTGHGARFPNPAAGQAFVITVQQGADFEIMRCTARSIDTLTVTRGQEGTTARAFSAGAAVEMRVTAGTVGGFVQGPPTLAASRLLGRGNGGAGVAASLSVAAPLTMGAAELTTSVATSRLLGRTDAGVGPAQEISVAAPLSLSSGALTTSMATSRLLGRTAAGVGPAQEISLDSGSLEFSGTQLRVPPGTFGSAADVSARVLKAGDNMSGFLTLHADPTSALHAATKQYVDGRTNPNRQVFTASGTWTKPTGYAADTLVLIECWGAGGGGANNHAGGGGGAYNQRFMRLADLGATETVTVGGGGAAGATGGVGGTSSFGAHLSAFGGGGGAQGSGAGGGGGGAGLFAAGGNGSGAPSAGGGGDGGGGGFNGGSGGAYDGVTPQAGGASAFGGGGGGADANGGTTQSAGGRSMWGGGGGGGGSSAGGVSTHGGTGGTGGTNNAQAPGGGGGRNQPGARGEVRVTVIA